MYSLACPPPAPATHSLGAGLAQLAVAVLGCRCATATAARCTTHNLISTSWVCLKERSSSTCKVHLAHGNVNLAQECGRCHCRRSTLTFISHPSASISSRRTSRGRLSLATSIARFGMAGHASQTVLVRMVTTKPAPSRPRNRSMRQQPSSKQKHVMTTSRFSLPPVPPVPYLMVHATRSMQSDWTSSRPAQLVHLKAQSLLSSMMREKMSS